MKKKKLPVYQLKINIAEDAVVSAISLVEEPAIESNFMAFSKQESLQFATNDTKQELIGAAMIPNQLIYRIDPITGEEFEVFFSADTIRQIAQQYMKLGFQNNMNLNHTAVPAKSYVYQSYITDKSKGINAPKGINVPDGTWIVGVKVDDANVWGEIKAGKVKGFSIEGLFEFAPAKFNKVDADDIELMKVLNQLNHIINKTKKNKNQNKCQ